MNVHGFDKSSYQAVGDWGQGGRKFAIMKATEGTGYFDKNFNANRKAAHDEGMIVLGFYHYARPDKTASAAAEAKWFLDHVGKPGPGEVAILDYEDYPGGTLKWNEDWAVAWANAVKAAGWRVLFYTYLGKLTSNPHAKIAAAFPDLWIAAYGTRVPRGNGWPQWTFWQHTDGQSSVSGNDASCDCSMFNGDEAALRAWAGNQPKEWDEMATQAEIEAAVRKVVREEFRSWQDGQVTLIDKADGKVFFKLVNGNVIWVAAPPGVKLTAGWTDKDGNTLDPAAADATIVEPGPAGHAWDVPKDAGVLGMWIRKQSGTGRIAIQLYTPGAGG